MKKTESKPIHRHSLHTAGGFAPRRVLRTLLACGLLGLAVLSLYGRTLKFSLTDLDDDNLMQNLSNRHYRLIDIFSANTFSQEKGDLFYRPILKVIFIINFAFSGTNASTYHLTSVILHVLAVCCLLHLLMLLGFDRRFSFLAAMVYSLHPLIVPAVAWIAAQADLLIGIFGLLAFISLLKFRILGRYRYLFLHAAAFFCATLSKENALMLPPLFIAYILLNDRKNALTIKNGILAILWVTVIAGYYHLRGSGIGGLPSPHMFGFGPLTGSLRALLDMLGYLAIPFDIPVMPGFSLPAMVAGLLVLAGIAVILGIQGKLARPTVILGVLWYLLLSIPGLMFRHEFGSHAYDFLNHRSYLPIVGIFLVLAEAIPPAWYLAGKRRFFVAASAVVLALGALAWRQCDYFKDPKAFFDQAVRTNPKSALALNNRSTLEMEHGDLSGSLHDCDAAIRLFPAYAEAYINRGNSRLMLGDAKGALADYSVAIDLSPGNVNAYDNRARAKDELGDTPGVIADLSQAIAIDPSTADRYFHRGRFEEAMGDTTPAIRDYSKAIELAPGFAEAYVKRGGIFARQRDSLSAESDFRKAISLDPRLAGELHLTP